MTLSEVMLMMTSQTANFIEYWEIKKTDYLENGRRLFCELKNLTCALNSTFWKVIIL